MTSRILGALGRFFITSGIVILLFVGYQLWGTGLQEASAQSDLESDFDELLESLDAPAPAPTTTAAPVVTSTTVAVTTTVPPSTIPAAGGTIPVRDAELANKLYRDGGEAVARIVIPSIDVTKVVVQGVQVEDLRNGPGHYRATVFPGQVGNSGIAGHRTTYGAPFNRVDELVPGDEILVSTVQGNHTYRVMPAGDAYSADKVGGLTDFVVPEGDEQLGHIIVGPEATWVLGDFGDNRITLTACHPKYSARQRIIVTAELVSDAVDAPPPPPDYSPTDKIDLASEDVGTGQDAADAQIVSAEVPDDPSDDVGREAIDADAVSDELLSAEVSLDEGLNGDKSALAPALLWGFAAIAVFQGFKQLARRWRRWPAIAVGLVPVVLLMGLSFEKIDRYLPAG
ncbi:MAG: sortase [Acidimicrobiia bacterium]|nr:sortase [Acidimicrobiia bacterium]